MYQEVSSRWETTFNLVIPVINFGQYYCLLFLDAQTENLLPSSLSLHTGRVPILYPTSCCLTVLDPIFQKLNSDALLLLILNESRYTKMPTSKRELKGSVHPSKYYQSKLPECSWLKEKYNRCVYWYWVAWILERSRYHQLRQTEQGPNNKQERNQMDGTTNRQDASMCGVCIGATSCRPIILTKEWG